MLSVQGTSSDWREPFFGTLRPKLTHRIALWYTVLKFPIFRIFRGTIDREYMQTQLDGSDVSKKTFAASYTLRGYETRHHPLSSQDRHTRKETHTKGKRERLLGPNPTE